MRHSHIALVAALILIPTASSAQLGGLVRRAADKAADKAVEKKTGGKTELPAPTFDDEVLELTQPRVDQVVRGLQAWNNARSRADVEGARKAHEAAQARELTFSTRYTDQRSAWQQKNWKIDSCRDEAFGEQQDANRAAIDKRMEEMKSNPALLMKMNAKLMEWSPRIAALQQSGDTAALKTALVKMNDEVATAGGLRIAIDSAKVNTKCGHPEPKPAWLLAWDSTEVETRKAGDRVREAETAGAAEAAAASGLTERQFMIARERLESFCGGGTMGFSRREREVLNPRRAELTAFFPKS